MLKIKLSRTGHKKQPTYRLVVAEARSKKNGAYLDSVGHYQPLPEKAIIAIDQKKYQDWLKKGAQPTRTVRLLYQRQYGQTT